MVCIFIPKTSWMRTVDQTEAFNSQWLKVVDGGFIDWTRSAEGINDGELPERSLGDCTARTAAEAISLLNENGFVILQGLVPAAHCDNIRHMVDAARSRATPDDYTGALEIHWNVKDLDFKLYKQFIDPSVYTDIQSRVEPYVLSSGRLETHLRKKQMRFYHSEL